MSCILQRADITLSIKNRSLLRDAELIIKTTRDILEFSKCPEPEYRVAVYIFEFAVRAVRILIKIAGLGTECVSADLAQKIDKLKDHVVMSNKNSEIQCVGDIWHGITPDL
jgi:hypothetical protein